MPHPAVEEVAEVGIDSGEDVGLEGDEPAVGADLGVLFLPLGPRLPVAGDICSGEPLERVEEPAVLVGKETQHGDERGDHVLLVPFDEEPERPVPLRAASREERATDQRIDIGIRLRETVAEGILPEGIPGQGGGLRRRLGAERRRGA